MQHADRVNAIVRDPSASARSSVYASWSRSLTRYGLDPQDTRPPLMLTERELREARQKVEALLVSASGTLDRLFQAVGNTGCCVLLTDRHGVPVERRGVGADDDIFFRWGLWTGAVWSEAREGTNGIGTCLAEERALTIHRDQHFHARNTGLSCTVAPIYDHEGQIAAALDVSSCRADLTADFVGLIAAAVVDAARRIEARHFRGAFPGARIGITDARLAACLPAADILSVEGDAGEDLALAERGVVQRALARSHGNVSEAARALGISRATLHRKMHRLQLVRKH
jgi:transcriptional regulator of acetoin/glycerol metabolism